MRKIKPRLSAGKTIQVQTGPASPDLAEHAPVIRTRNNDEALPVRAGRSLIGFALGTVTLLAALAFILSTTVLVAMSAGDHRAVVLRGAYPVGSIPDAALVYASSAPIDHSFPGRVNQTFSGVPAGSVVQVIAGPHSRVSQAKNGTVLENGKPTAFQVPITATTLDRQYIALCITGGCAPGTAVVIDQDNILGGVRGYLTVKGITPVPTTVKVPDQ